MPESLSEVFIRLARDDFRDSSPLYERLSLGVAQNADLLHLAADCRKGERVPNLFFAAVHFLLLGGGIKHALARFYPSLGGSYDGRADPFPDFRSFCGEFAEPIRQIIAVRLVQTNEVSRCAGLMPMIATGAKEFGGRPLYLVDIGASAGLNLLWDRYGYKYGADLTAGDRSSLVQIECAMDGAKLPTLPSAFPQICGRVGVDLNPLDVRVAEDALWLRALVWPEHLKRAELLGHAIGIARQQRLELIAGDGVERLSEVMGLVPAEAVLSVVRIFTRIPSQSRERWTALLADYGAKRDLMVITARPHGADDSDLVLTAFVAGRRSERAMARMQNHGDWIEWLNPQ
ncbi:MAG: DUF2332 domain-containing protein [Deltaproteobacteria bacterium]|nr:DUF2332 domain-containing protein [Deltaproteobacteria bacterium]